MKNVDLQKSAEFKENDKVPKEVLNPIRAAQMYTFHTYPPTSDLADFIDYYWTMRWDLRGRPPFIAEVIPSPYTNLTFMPGGARITGITTGKYTYELKGQGVIIGVKFKPGGLHTFWKKGLHELTDKFLPAFELFPEVDAAYNDSIMKQSDATALKHVEELLHAAKPKVDKSFGLVIRILGYLETSEQPSLVALVRQSGLSERRLQEVFREYVGVGIKWIILRARLLKAVELATALEDPNWTAIAQDLGYGDQSHFINDFKRIIGKTPAQYTATIK